MMEYPNKKFLKTKETTRFTELRTIKAALNIVIIIRTGYTV